LFYVLRNDDKLLGEKGNQLFAVNMLFKAVQFSVQHHPRRVLAYQVRIRVEQVELFPLVINRGIIVGMLGCSDEMKLDGSALFQDFEPTPRGFAVVRSEERRVGEWGRFRGCDYNVRTR